MHTTPLHVRCLTPPCTFGGAERAELLRDGAIALAVAAIVPHGDWRRVGPLAGKLTAGAVMTVGAVIVHPLIVDLWPHAMMLAGLRP